MEEGILLDLWFAVGSRLDLDYNDILASDTDEVGPATLSELPAVLSGFFSKLAFSLVPILSESVYEVHASIIADLTLAKK